MIHVLEAVAHRVARMGLSVLVFLSLASYHSQRAHPTRTSSTAFVIPVLCSYGSKSLLLEYSSSWF